MHSSARGTTLPELMAAMAILAITAGIAMPSFSRLIADNRLQTASSTLLSSLVSARVEAVRRGRQVAVFASGAGWGGGWTIAEDGNCNDRLDAGDTVLQRLEAPAGGIVISGNQAARTLVSYEPTGVANLCRGGLIMATLRLGGDATDTRYAISINAGGRPSRCRTRADGTCLR